MAKLIATRGAQFVMETEFTFNFDDTMVPVSGGTAIPGTTEVDFGKTNIISTVFDIINLPAGAVVLSGFLTVETAFDTASYSVAVGDSAVANRYLTAADRKATGVTALVPTGYRGDGENLRVTIVKADVCTTGKATLRIQYITTGRSNEVNPN
jgi:hypothetical protein